MALHIVNGIDKDSTTSDITIDKSVIEVAAARDYYLLLDEYNLTKIRIDHIALNIATWVVTLHCTDVDGNKRLITDTSNIYATVAALKTAQATALDDKFDSQGTTADGKGFSAGVSDDILAQQ